MDNHVAQQQQELQPRDIPLRTFHLFAGAGGGILADLILGHQPVGACEIEEYPRKVLLQRQQDGILPEFPIWDDIKTLNGKPWRGRVDVVSGGFPCQDISAAGAGAGIRGERSGLWAEMARVCSEIRPKYIFVENSPMLTHRGLGVVLGDLATMGYDARWGVLGADDASMRHRRKRIWIYATNACVPRLKTCDKQTQEAWQVVGKQLGRSDGVSLREGLREWVEAESGVCGVANGVAHRVDRLKAIGNGQVPAVAALAWKILTNG
jgi:DNA (cytosine-5)-methyltransferase 1